MARNQDRQRSSFLRDRLATTGFNSPASKRSGAIHDMFVRPAVKKGFSEAKSRLGFLTSLRGPRRTDGSDPIRDSSFSRFSNATSSRIGTGGFNPFATDNSGFEGELERLRAQNAPSRLALQEQTAERAPESGVFQGAGTQTAVQPVGAGPTVAPKTVEQLANDRAADELRQGQAIQFRGEGGVIGGDIDPRILALLSGEKSGDDIFGISENRQRELDGVPGGVLPDQASGAGTGTTVGSTATGQPTGDATDIPQTGGSQSFNDFNAMLDSAAKGENFLSPQEIQQAEDSRQSEMRAIINASFDKLGVSEEKRGQLLIQGVGSLGTNLGGGAQNFVSTTLDAVGRENDALSERLASINQERGAALRRNDIAGAQRLEDRLATLHSEKRAAEANMLNRLQLFESSKQFEKQYGLQLDQLDQDKQKNIAAILSAGEDRAMDTVEFLIDKFGSMAASGLDETEILALEAATGVLPVGTLLRGEQTLEERKDNQLDFQGGTKFQEPGFTDPNTGEFFLVPEARRHAQDIKSGSSSALLTDPETHKEFLRSFIKSDNKEFYHTKLGKDNEDAANFLLFNPELQSMMAHGPPTDAETEAILNYMETVEEFGRENVGQEDAIGIFEDAGVDINKSPIILSLIGEEEEGFFGGLVPGFQQ